MHRANERIKNSVGFSDKKRYSNYTFSDSLKSSILADLRRDACDYAFNSLFSFYSACQGFARGELSWGVVKVYYSSFYAIRSILSLNGVAVGYRGTSPFYYNVSDEKIFFEKGNTHEVVFNVFRKNFPNNILISEIEGVSSFEWLKEKRELIHYKSSSFQEPNIPLFFPFSTRLEMDSRIELYFLSNNHDLSFDKDHALFSFPVEILKSLKRNLKRSSCWIDDDKYEFLRNYAPTLSFFERAQ